VTAQNTKRLGYPQAGGEQSRRDRGLTALIEGLFGFMWFGWGQADPPAGWRIVLGAGAVVALLVAVAGAVQAVRSPASSGALHDRQVRRRYIMVVGVEFAGAAAGAALLSLLGQTEFVPVWICGVVGLHFFFLAPVLNDAYLVPLGALLLVVAVGALVAELATDIAASTVTGIGAGSLLSLFAGMALSGVGARSSGQGDR
jgi:hypothetical protein